MKRYVPILNALFLSASSLGLVFVADNALATPVVEVNLDSSVEVTGTYLISPLGRPNPAVYQIFAGANECLRILGTAQTVDVEATVVGPAGTTWQDDDGGGSALPFVKAITNETGWHTLHVSHYNGGGTNGTFTLNIGRFASNSNLCTSPTTPRSVETRTTK